MVTKTFGDILFTPGSECLKQFPSPESLKKRIIISTKPPKKYLKTKDVPKEGEPQKEKTSSNDKDTSAWGREVSSLKGGIVTDYKVCDGAHEFRYPCDFLNWFWPNAWFLHHSQIWKKIVTKRKILRMEIPSLQTLHRILHLNIKI